jgi:hypothetical protein
VYGGRGEERKGGGDGGDDGDLEVSGRGLKLKVKEKREERRDEVCSNRCHSGPEAPHQTRRREKHGRERERESMAEVEAEVVAKERTSLTDAPQRGATHLIEKAIRNHARELNYWAIVYLMRKKPGDENGG